MRKTTILNKDEIQRLTIPEATERFLRDCRIRNLSAQTLVYYEEDCKYFYEQVPLKFIDQINGDVFEEFVAQELEKGKKVTSLNSRIRGLRVFFRFCAEREYMSGFKFPLLKEDKEIKKKPDCTR
jgi:integrase/recombinase XerD